LLFRFGDFTLDAERLELKRSGEVQKLEPQVFSLLVYLVENRDRVISKDELIDGVWGGRIVSDATLNTCVNGLRRVLGDSGRAQSVVRTFPRRGFRFVAQVGNGQDLSKAEQPKPILANLTEDRPSIAVLPFKFLSSEPDQEFIAEGLVEDIITLLSTVPELFVIARNTTFTYKDQTPDAGTVAKELDVRYVLEGSVRKAGDRIRVSAQFIDALTGSHIWADRYDRDIDDIFELQDEVSQGIVGALQSRLLIAESAHMSRMPADRVDAWGNVVKARVRMFAYRPEDIDEAEPFARRALKIQPDYAPAFAILAQILAWRSYNGWTDNWLGVAREAMACARRALEINANNPTVLADIAFAYIWLGLWGNAVPIAERAVELNPNSAFNCSVCGHLLAVAGRTEEGIELTRKAFLLSPKDPLEYMFHLYEGSAFYFADDRRAAKRAIEHSLRLKPDLMFARLFLAAILVHEGHMEQAKRELHRITQFGSEDAIKNIFRPRTTGTLWHKFTDPIRDAYDGDLPEQPD